MSLFIYPYRTASGSAKDLSKALGVKRIRKNNSKFKGNADKIVINWGCSTVSPEVAKCKVVNTPEAVALAADKLKFFKTIEEHNNETFDIVNIPDVTDSFEEAQRWLDCGVDVVERHVLNGNSGEGIKIKGRGDVIEDCPLYTTYIKKKSEWRIHVCDGEVVDVQRKARDRSVPDDQVNWKVRNHSNGFIFARNEGEEAPEEVLEQALKAVEVIGLDFGAVDVIYNQSFNRAVVLEVNTAPGLTGSTLGGYVSRFKEMCGE